MTEQERIEFQGQKIKQLLEENEELKKTLEVFASANELLKKNKDDLELELIERNEQVQSFIEQYKVLVADMESMRKEYSEAKAEYLSSVTEALSAVAEAKQRINKFNKKNGLK